MSTIKKGHDVPSFLYPPAALGRLKRAATTTPNPYPFLLLFFCCGGKAAGRTGPDFHRGRLCVPGACPEPALNLIQGRSGSLPGGARRGRTGARAGQGGWVVWGKMACGVQHRRPWRPEGGCKRDVSGASERSAGGNGPTPTAKGNQQGGSVAGGGADRERPRLKWDGRGLPTCVGTGSRAPDLAGTVERRSRYPADPRHDESPDASSGRRDAALGHGMIEVT